MTEQIWWENHNVQVRAEAHACIAARWERVAAWTRLAVSLTAGVSAISVFADNLVAASVFSLVTAAVTAVNAGFSPSEAAKRHRDASRAYGHLVRPLSELCYVIDASVTTTYVPRVEVVEGQSVDVGGYRRELSLSDDETAQLWRDFQVLRDRLEALGETEPALSSAQWTATSDRMEREWQERATRQPPADAGSAR